MKKSYSKPTLSKKSNVFDGHGANSVTIPNSAIFP